MEVQVLSPAQSKWALFWVPVFIVVGEKSKLLCFCEDLKAGICRFATMRWGREHLVDFERSDKIYLMIRDQVLSPAQKRTSSEVMTADERAEGANKKLVSLRYEFFISVRENFFKRYFY